MKREWGHGEKTKSQPEDYIWNDLSNKIMTALDYKPQNKYLLLNTNINKLLNKQEGAVLPYRKIPINKCRRK